MILRAIFWITAMTVLMPHETVQDRSASFIVPGEAQYAFGDVADTNFLAEFQVLALRSLQELKQERSALRHLEESPNPQE